MLGESCRPSPLVIFVWLASRVIVGSRSLVALAGDDVFRMQVWKQARTVVFVLKMFVEFGVLQKCVICHADRADQAGPAIQEIAFEDV